ncbi:hypothetical protein HNQ60_001208 [Povalibacter uvarum]|uniref:Uncharacterized protein n=1 Tax=Povalibacter uvarum TaxID=732238 RepID=A0A841HJN5_9GAMM|nr:hypothetical protein [Povalibacter uvarum]MBB6092362.1 hypothetical protein [Povalibacter uvarum]
MSSKTHPDRDGPEYVDGHGDKLEIYPTIGGRVCIRQTKAKVSEDYPCIFIHPDNVGALIDALRLIKQEAAALAVDNAERNI